MATIILCTNSSRIKYNKLETLLFALNSNGKIKNRIINYISPFCPKLFR